VRIVIVAKRTCAHGYGGTETSVHGLARTAVALGHDVVVVTTAHPEGRRTETLDGIRFAYLRGTPPGIYSPVFWSASGSAVRDIVAGAGDPIVLGVNLSGYGVLRQGVPAPQYVLSSGRTISHLVSEWHNWRGLRGLASYPKHAAALLRYAAIERRLCARVDAVIAEDDRLHAAFVRRGVPCVLSYAGVDPRQFRPDVDARLKLRADLGIADDAEIALVAATVNRQKGVAVAIDAVHVLAAVRPRLHLLITGDGPERPMLERTIRSRGLQSRVHLAGAVIPDAMPRYHAGADVLLYPTLRREGLPRAILEAMACGVPVVASDRGGIPSAVRHGETGVLLRHPTCEALAGATSALLDDPCGRRRLASRARALVLEQFDLRVTVPALLDELGRRRAASRTSGGHGGASR
jgi:glycosyltransferase involved in cell wall biosynthesis